MEASLVFPVLFIVLMLMMLLGMYVYQKNMIYFAASTAAERTAFRWDNSFRDPQSAMAPAGQYDDLYWRLHSDGAVQSLFFGRGEEGSYRMQFPQGQEGAGEDALPNKKMKKNLSSIPASYHGEISYSFGLLQKKVGVELANPLSVKSLQPMLRSRLETSSSAVIVDPVEFIRNVDLVRYYTAKLQQLGGSGKKYRSDAAEILKKQAARPEGEQTG